jgi:hypothetical protein
VRNLFERAIERQASRLVDDADPTDLELTTLTGADLVDPSGAVGEAREAGSAGS